MTIKEMETSTGMTRANIRFYESEGLLLPARSSNGYRDYSENDREVLKRIQLLRTLHISLEEIKLLQSGDRELVEALDQHLAELESQKTDLEQSQEICEVMRSDGVQYQTLDAQHYLDAIENLTQKPVPELAADAAPKVRSPWRRFLARNLDLFIYSALWEIFLSAVMNVNVTSRSGASNILDTLVGLLLMIFIEPALLAVFGTTVGKWVLGLRVADSEDRRLSYPEALSRTWTVFWSGMGLNIPIYNLVRCWKSYQACEEGKTLEWEKESTLSLRDEKVWRAGAYLGVYILLIGMLVLTVSMAGMPKHRGEITVAEFTENYNRLSDYFGVDTGSFLDETGEWTKAENAAYSIQIGGDTALPEYSFTEKDGVMTGMSFSTELHGSDSWAPSYQNAMLLSIFSFVRAQKGCGPFSKDVNNILKQISESPFQDFQYTVYGVSLTCDVEYSGYMDTESMGMLWPAEGAEPDYSFHFTMAKE